MDASAVLDGAANIQNDDHDGRDDDHEQDDPHAPDGGGVDRALLHAADLSRGGAGSERSCINVLLIFDNNIYKKFRQKPELLFFINSLYLLQKKYFYFEPSTPSPRNQNLI